MSVKKETREKNKKRKVSTITKVMKWLVDTTGRESIQEVIERISSLGDTLNGYFVLYPAACSSQVIAAIIEFVQYLLLENYIQAELAAKTQIRLSKMKRNLIRKQAPKKAKANEEDRKGRISEDNIQELYRSKKSRIAKDLLKKKPHIINVKMREVSCIRDYLIFKLIERNFLRPAALYHLPVHYFLPGEGASIKQKSGQYEIPLFYDKTIGSTARANYLHLQGIPLKSTLVGARRRIL